MAQKLQEIKDQLNRSLKDTSKPWTGILTQAEQKTGVDRLYVFIGGIAVVGLWLVFGYAAQLICNLIGFLYPAYMSMHAIESHKKDDDTKWLTYWVVFALFSITEYFADFIVGWFPLYWLIKCIFMVWLMIPSDFNGSVTLYNRIVRPYFLKHHNSIDETLNKVKEQDSIYKNTTKMHKDMDYHAEDHVNKLDASLNNSADFNIFDYAEQEGLRLPKFLKNILTLMGYDNIDSLGNLTEADFSEIEEIFRSDILKFVDKSQHEDYCGPLYKKNPESFKLLRPQKNLLLTLAKIAADRVASRKRKATPAEKDNTHSKRPRKKRIRSGNSGASSGGTIPNSAAAETEVNKVTEKSE